MTYVISILKWFFFCLRKYISGRYELLTLHNDDCENFRKKKKKKKKCEQAVEYLPPSYTLQISNFLCIRNYDKRCFALNKRLSDRCRKNSYESLPRSELIQQTTIQWRPFGWNVKICFVGKIRKKLLKCRLLIFLPRVLRLLAFYLK